MKTASLLLPLDVNLRMWPEMISQVAYCREQVSENSNFSICSPFLTVLSVFLFLPPPPPRECLSVFPFLSALFFLEGFFLSFLTSYMCIYVLFSSWMPPPAELACFVWEQEYARHLSERKRKKNEAGGTAGQTADAHSTAEGVGQLISKSRSSPGVCTSPWFHLRDIRAVDGNLLFLLLLLGFLFQAHLVLKAADLYSHLSSDGTSPYTEAIVIDRHIRDRYIDRWCCDCSSCGSLSCYLEISVLLVLSSIQS